MATISLNAGKINLMPGLLGDVRQSVEGCNHELSALYEQMIAIDSTVCDLSGAAGNVKAVIERQVGLSSILFNLRLSNEYYIDDLVRLDQDVSQLVNRTKGNFYKAFNYLNPVSEKSIWGKFADGVKQVGDWCKKLWSKETLNKLNSALDKVDRFLNGEIVILIWDTTDVNHNGIEDYREKQWVELTNKYRALASGSTRDVTEEVNAALREQLKEGDQYSSWEQLKKIKDFYNLVNHEAPWDIKREQPWRDTIGTEYPGTSDTPVLYNGRYFTPESLGNYTYGALGRAYGFDLETLLNGSMYAQGFPRPGSKDYKNEMIDRLYITEGYYSLDKIKEDTPEE